MKLVYLKRTFLLNKVIKKIPLTRELVNMLYCIYIMQPARYTHVFDKLYFVGRMMKGTQFKKGIDYLTAEGLIARDQANKYSLTASGLDALKDVERRLRIERHDR